MWFKNLQIYRLPTPWNIDFAKLPSLKQQMQEAADNYAFEEAARLRDQLQAVARLNEAQKAVTNNGCDISSKFTPNC